MKDYQTIIKQAGSLVEGEPNLVANLANISALLFEELKPLWVGFYLYDANEKNLVLGPFQGPLACTRIPIGKGVCGVAFETQKTQVVPDVHQFPGHIACSAKSNSEIVVPIIKNGECVAVLDIDSEKFDDFSEVDQQGLEKLCHGLSSLF